MLIRFYSSIKTNFVPRRILATVIPILAISCSSTQPPRAEIAQAEQLLRTALTSKAPQFAPADFSKAQEKLNEAKSQFARENYEGARRLSEEAKADAEYALASAEAKYAEEQLTETRINVQSSPTSRIK